MPTPLLIVSYLMRCRTMYIVLSTDNTIHIAKYDTYPIQGPYMATRKLIVYLNKDLMIQAGAQRFVLALLDLLAE